MRYFALFMAYLVIPGGGAALVQYLWRQRLLSGTVFISLGLLLGPGIAVFTGLAAGAPAESVAIGAVAAGPGLAFLSALAFAWMKRRGSEIPW